MTVWPIAAALMSPDHGTKYAAFQVPSFALPAEEPKDVPLMFTAPNAPGTQYHLWLTSEPAQITWEPWDVALS